MDFPVWCDTPLSFNGFQTAIFFAFCCKESHAWKESDLLFHDGEWLWADSAYALTPWCIIPYKCPQSLVLANCQFNYHLSKVCPPIAFVYLDDWLSNTKVHIWSEHAVGYLKGCFQSLCGLCQQINSEHDYILTLSWVWACVIIHSLVAWLEDFESDVEFSQWVVEGLSDHTTYLEDDAEVEGFTWTSSEPCALGESEGQCKCRHVQEALFHALY